MKAHAADRALTTVSFATRALWICKPEIQRFIYEHAGTTGYLLQECRKVYPTEACDSAQRALGDGPDLFSRMRQLCAGYGGLNYTDGYDPLAGLPADIRDSILADGKDKDGHTITVGGGKGLSINGKSPWGHIPGPGEIFDGIRHGFGGSGGSGSGSGGSGGSSDSGSSGGSGGHGYPDLYPGVRIPGFRPHYGEAGAGPMRGHGGPIVGTAGGVGSSIDGIVDEAFGTIKGLLGRADPTSNNGDSRDGRRITGPAVPTEQVPYMDASLRGKPESTKIGNPFDWEREVSDEDTRIAEAANAVRIYGAEKGEPTDHVEGMRIDDQERAFDIAHPLPMPNISLNHSAAQPMPNISAGPPPLSEGVDPLVPPPLAVVADSASDAAASRANSTRNTTAEIADAIAAALASQLAQATATTTGAAAPAPAPAPNASSPSDPETFRRAPILAVTTFPPLQITAPPAAPAALNAATATATRLVFPDRVVPSHELAAYPDRAVPAMATTNFLKVAVEKKLQQQHHMQELQGQLQQQMQPQEQPQGKAGLYFPALGQAELDFPATQATDPARPAFPQPPVAAQPTELLATQQDISDHWTGLRGSPAAAIAAAMAPSQDVQPLVD